MLPGPTLIRQCNKCGGEYSERTISSGNTFGADFWSDGFSIAPMLPENHFLVKCPHCKNISWKEADKILKELELHDPEFEKWYKPEYLLPEAEDFLYALKDEKINTNSEREIYFRIKFWHFSNRKFRGGKNKDQNFLQIEIDNLMKIIKLLDLEDEGERLIVAEIYRELSYFDESLKLLDFEFSDDYKWKSDSLKQKVLQKDRFVYKF